MIDQLIYPEPSELKPNLPPTIWQRYRIVIPCCDKEQMDRVSHKIETICGHYKETFAGLVDPDTRQILGEVPFARDLVPTVAQVVEPPDYEA